MVCGVGWGKMVALINGKNDPDLANQRSLCQGLRKMFEQFKPQEKYEQQLLANFIQNFLPYPFYHQITHLTLVGPMALLDKNLLTVPCPRSACTV